MDAWITIMLLSITFSFLALRILFSNISRKKSRLPPGPPSIPIVTTLLWLTRSLADINTIFCELRVKYGPVLTLPIATRTAVLIADHAAAHRALVQSGADFADRPPVPKFRSDLLGTSLIVPSPYGPTWRVLRGNLTSKLLHPSRVKHFAEARRWALRILLDNLNHHRQAEESDGGAAAAAAVASSSFQDAVYSLMLFMCFGEKLGEKKVAEIRVLLKSLESSLAKASVFASRPAITKLVFRKKWNALVEIRRKCGEIFIPVVRARGEREQKEREKESSPHPYVDSLLELEIPEGGGSGRKLTEEEVVNLCIELILVGAGTTTTALEWVMAGIVIHQQVQQKLWEEIQSVLEEEIVSGSRERGVVNCLNTEIKEEDLHRMPYLRAIVLEGLRRYPLSHFGAPHGVVAKEIEFDEKYVVPKGALVLFMLAEMGFDEKVWEEPMEFRPERFMPGGTGEGIDITGSREIKMIPFGAGRRICPGLGLAMLHLQYFVANLVREFEWKAEDGGAVDLSAKWENSLTMKNPLRAKITTRRNKN